MRCFVAAFLAPESARALHELARRQLGSLLTDAAGAERALRLVPLENLHVTVRFIGEVDAGAVAGLAAAVADLRGTPSQASVTAIGGFPQPAGARIVAAELAPQARLAAWSRALAASLGPGSDGAAGRDFRPHVTVARSRRKLTRLPLAAPRPLPRPLPLMLGAPALYRSDPSPTGVRYRKATAG